MDNTGIDLKAVVEQLQKENEKLREEKMKLYLSYPRLQLLMRRELATFFNDPIRAFKVAMAISCLAAIIDVVAQIRKIVGNDE